ncbi:hypothetical protein SIID45300_01483 [Candidatus Magnetaquicoccaceae bacterium FCR-1]|uniref:PAS domain-containing protein n=1 Tax=Candidatus Magnetaquiglobus chichijimensis TaxID=3141448 RepID=A0ABQ0C8E9_9PROT
MPSPIPASVDPLPSESGEVGQKSRFDAGFVPALLARLGRSVPMLVLIAALGGIMPFYWLQARPLAETNAFLHQQVVADRVTREFAAMAEQIDALLLSIRDLARDGRISLDDTPGLNGLLIPIIQSHGLISSFHLAGDGARETMLLKSPEGWKNRLSDLNRNPRRHQWLTWQNSRTPAGEEWREQDYDMRKRPWFAGALSTPEDQVHWTEPYIFATTREPGITASTSWSDRASGQRFVVAFDVLLNDMSRMTTRMRFGKRGYVALLAADGKVLGLPGEERFANRDVVLQSVLRESGKIGLPVLAEALRLAANSDDRETFRIPPEIVGQEEAWLVGLHPFMVHQQKFRVATFAPESESRVISGHLLSVLLGVMGAIALTAMLAARALVSRVRKPLLRAFAELESNHARQRQLTARSVLVGEIVTRLQQAHTPLELGQTLLSSLAAPLNLGLGLICLWNEAEQRLVPLARYAGIGGTPEETARPVGALLRQCALERRPFTLDRPGRSYFHIRSGLGDSVPGTILLQPVMHAGRLFAVLELAMFRPLTDEDHALLGELQPTVAMSLDILLRAERTAELLAQATAAEEWSRQILGAVEGGILGVDATGRIIFINRSALAMFAMPENSAIGLAIVDLFHASAEEHPASGETPIDRTLRDGRPRTRQEVRCRRRDRTPLLVDYACTAIERDGRIIGAVVTFEESETTAPGPARSGDSESGSAG